VSYCRGCGKELQSDWVLCPYCGESQDHNHYSGSNKKVKCPECEKSTSSLKTCRVCDYNKFCTYCHNQRKRDVHTVGFGWSFSEEYYTKKYELKIKTKYGNNRAWVKRLIETNLACMECSIEHFTENFSDNDNKDYVKLVEIWKKRVNGMEEQQEVSKDFRKLEAKVGEEISIIYDSASSGKKNRILVPLEIYISSEREYFKAICKESDKEKVFRIDRIIKFTD
jgi:hypothetical protein